MPSDIARGGWLRRLFSRSSSAPLDGSRTDLVVVASSFDDAEASSDALERAQAEEPTWSSGDQVLFRHHLVLPSGAIEDAVAIAGQDGYERGDDAMSPIDTEIDGPVGIDALHVAEAQVLVLQRVQVLDALHCSQERSRMAGLAQRRRGVVAGWDALQPPKS